MSATPQVARGAATGTHCHRTAVPRVHRTRLTRNATGRRPPSTTNDLKWPGLWIDENSFDKENYSFLWHVTHCVCETVDARPASGFLGLWPRFRGACKHAGIEVPPSALGTPIEQKPSTQTSEWPLTSPAGVEGTSFGSREKGLGVGGEPARARAPAAWTHALTPR